MQQESDRAAEAIRATWLNVVPVAGEFARIVFVVVIASLGVATMARGEWPTLHLPWEALTVRMVAADAARALLWVVAVACWTVWASIRNEKHYRRWALAAAAVVLVTIVRLALDRVWG